MINSFSILNGEKYLFSGIFQNYSLFMPAKKYIKYFSGITQIDFWKSNGIPEENIENITKLYSNFAPTFVNHHALPDINFNGHCLINNISIPKKVINLHNSYILNPWLRNLHTDFLLNNWLFGPVKLTKNADQDKYKYSGYGIYHVYTIMEVAASYFLMLQKYISSKQKTLKCIIIQADTLSIGSISKVFTISNMKKIGLKGAVIFFWLILILLILTIF